MRLVQYPLTPEAVGSGTSAIRLFGNPKSAKKQAHQ